MDGGLLGAETYTETAAGLRQDNELRARGEKFDVPAPLDDSSHSCLRPTSWPPQTHLG